LEEQGWSSLFGRQVHSCGIGGLKSRLRTSLETSIPVERKPTTLVVGGYHRTITYTPLGY